MRSCNLQLTDPSSLTWCLVDDFQFVPSGKVLHVLNVPSPATTAPLMIGKAIVDSATDLGPA